MASKYEALKQRMQNWREKGQEQLGHVLQSVEIGGTAFGFGFLRGKMSDADGNLDVAGMPVSLAAAVAGHGLGFMGVFGKHSEHAHNLADGALAEYSAVAGMRMGAARSDNPGTKRIAGRRSVAGLSQGQNPFQQRVGMGSFTRNISNPHVAR